MPRQVPTGGPRPSLARFGSLRNGKQVKTHSWDGRAREAEPAKQPTFDLPGRRWKTGDGKCLNLQELNCGRQFSNTATTRADEKKKKRLKVDGLRTKKQKQSLQVKKVKVLSRSFILPVKVFRNEEKSPSHRPFTCSSVLKHTILVKNQPFVMSHTKLVTTPTAVSQLDLRDIFKESQNKVFAGAG